MISVDYERAKDRLMENETMTLAGVRDDDTFMDVYSLWISEIDALHESFP